MTPSEWLDAQPDLIECPIGPCKMTLRACEARQAYFPKLNCPMPGTTSEGLGAVSRYFIHCLECPRFVKTRNTYDELTKQTVFNIGNTERSTKGWAKTDGRGRNLARARFISKKLNATDEEEV